MQKCITTLDRDLSMSPLQYTVPRGEQVDQATAHALKQGQAFVVRETETSTHRESVHSGVEYDLICKLMELVSA